jgi:hypothetical protein
MWGAIIGVLSGRPFGRRWKACWWRMVRVRDPYSTVPGNANRKAERKILTRSNSIGYRDL